MIPVNVFMDPSSKDGKLKTKQNKFACHSLIEKKKERKKGNASDSSVVVTYARPQDNNLHRFL